MSNSVQLLTVLLSVTSIALVIWGGRRANVAPLITIAWVLHCTLWLVTPLVLQLVLEEPVVNSEGPLSRAQLSLLASGSMLALAVCYLGLRRPLAVPVTRFFDDYAPPASKLFWPTAISTVLLAVIERALSARAGASFAEVVAFAVTADNSQQAQSGLLGTLEGMLVGYAIAVISMGRKTGVTRNTLIMAWLSVATFCAFMIARGTRSTVFLPIVLGLVALSALHGRTRRRAAIALAIGGAALITVGAPVAAIMGAARGGTGGISLQLIEEAYYVTIGSRSPYEQFQLLAIEINRKFDAIGPGVELLAMEPPGSAGVTPILSATFSPVPRALYLTKPVPTSRDGTYLGTPYRVAAKAYGNVDVGMIVPVSAPAIAVWEFASVGPLIFVLMNLFNLVLLNTVFNSRNVIARSLGVSILSLPTAELFIGPPSLLLQLGLRLMMFLTLLALVSMGWRLLVQQLRSRQAALTAGDVGVPSLPSIPG